MFFLSSMGKSRRKSTTMRLIVLAICLLLEISARCSLAENATGGADEESAPSIPVTAAAADADNTTADITQGLRNMMASLFASVPPSLMRKLNGANIRQQCRLALLRTVAAFEKPEPWALRLFDATGKYPTGVLQVTRVDLGAFDECIETEVRDSSGNVSSRGQYCNLQIQPKTDALGPKEMEFLSAMVHPKAAVTWAVCSWVPGSCVLTDSDRLPLPWPTATLLRPNLDEIGASIWQHGTSTWTRGFSCCTYNRQPSSACFGYGAASGMGDLRPLLLQAAVTWAVCSCVPGSCVLTDSDRLPLPWPTATLLRPNLDEIGASIWQHGTSTSTRGFSCCTYNRQPSSACFGYGAASGMGDLRPLLLQILDFMGAVKEQETPLIRIGICFLDDCNESDLQALADAVQPPMAEIRVSNCVTAEPEPWSSLQIGIVAFLIVLGVIIVGATNVDLTIGSKSKYAEKGGMLLEVVVAFSAAASTRELFHVAERTNADHYSLRFVYGLRTISIGHIVLGHSFQVVSDTWARMLNMMIISTRADNLILPAAYNSVDTFFFLSGFLLCLAITKQKRNSILVFVIAVYRRLIRTGVPIFFVITCIFVLPLVVTGPDAKTFFQKFNEEIGENWWHLIIPIRNFFDMTERSVMIHLWYVSADFQLFVVSLLVLQLLKSQKRLAIGAFIGLSLLGCAIALWTATDPDILPFLTFPSFTETVMLKTMNKYYMRPFYHAICFFSGCITLLVLDNFKNLKISKAMNAAGWFVAISCALCVVFMKSPWYKRPDPTSEAVKLIAAFFDRFLWIRC
ncbi:uncharacterized protein [Dermacentor albipictus]|uniref:uncharacterized protein isoform X3 n=1 Tax=Dermacentor albipictus TaxID=60249 RepID=UPI0038FD1195